MSVASLVAKITNAGKSALFSAENDGLQIQLTEVRLGDGRYSPTGAETDLSNEVESHPITGYSRPSPDLIQFNLQAPALVAPATEYFVSEIGVYTSGGILFAILSHPTERIHYRTTSSDFALNIQFTIADLPSEQITVTVTGENRPFFKTEQLAAVIEGLAISMTMAVANKIELEQKS